MAKIRNIVMEGATGRLGSMVLTQRAGTGTVARTLAPEVSNPKSDAQQTRRVKWANLVNFYKVSKGWMAKAYENKAANQSDYNKFMSLNANNTLVALTKDEASQGGVIAGPYTISQGSLPSVEITQLSAGDYATNISLGSLTIGSETTIADFSRTVINNNAWLKAGMQLSFISYQQQTNGVTGVPYCICGWYEVTLNINDATPLNNVMPISFAAASVDNNGKYLGTGSALSSGAFAYVVSNRVGGKLLVSTQQLTVNNNAQYNAATTRAALEAAIQSYGRGTEVFLAPGYTGDAQSQKGVNSIVSVSVNGREVMPGKYLGLSYNDINSNHPAIVINLANELDGAVTEYSVFVAERSGEKRELTGSASIVGNKFTLQNATLKTTATGSQPLTRVTFVQTDGATLDAEFSNTSGTVVE